MVETDLRDKVEEDRGLIKKIELWIPGFRGYRKREDLRIADSLLRTHLADAIRSAGTTVEQCRDVLVKKMKLGVLEDIGKLVNKINGMENRVRHVEQGYTGLSPDIRIDITELNRLYEWDLQMLDHIQELNKIATTFKTSIDDDSRTKEFMNDLESRINNFDQIFDKRIQIVAGLM